MEVFKSWPSNWLKLDKIIARIVDAINYRTPIRGDGILLTELPTGVIISLDPKTDTRAQQQQPSGGGGGTPQLVTWNGVGWTTITVVDPATCAQSSIQVLTQQPGNSIQIQ